MTKLKTIPQVRDELIEVALELEMWGGSLPLANSRRIKRLVKSLHRRPPVRRAAKEHAKVTPALYTQIKLYAGANPSMSYARIGARFNVSNGRVSEIVAGKRAA